uniref:Uncharacterized protein n=1 Tax=Anguilla anguilla TaxID=7936 RepID=A0A0E9SYH2_ANGAN
MHAWCASMGENAVLRCVCFRLIRDDDSGLLVFFVCLL